MKIDFHFDFETRSHADLRKVGSVKYATHPTTEATLLTWAFGRSGTVKAWKIGQPIPQEIIKVAQSPGLYNMIAHNILFDYLIWTVVYSKLIPTMKRPSINDLTDNMAHTCHFRCGASLDNSAKILGLPYSKDKDGRRIMLKQCKPNSRTGEYPVLTEEEQAKFTHYGKVDTRLLRDVYYLTPPLPAPERYTWEWTFRRNLQGVRADVPLIMKMNEILDSEKPKLIKEFEWRTGGIKIGSTKCKEFFKPHYPYIENMQADTIRTMMADKNPAIPTHVRRALEIKDLAGSTSLAKIPNMVRRLHAGRIYELLAYHYAQTKRWAGRGVQVQNFPRPIEKADSMDFDMNIPDLAGLVESRRATLKDPLGFIKNLLRRIWIPADGNEFYCGDWSKIEPTVLFWLVGLGSVPAKWYEDMAATIYGVDISEIGPESEERTLGKCTNLGCGYGMGHVKFRDDTFKKSGLLITEELAKRAVYAYRNKYAQVTTFWKELEWAYKAALRGTTTQLCQGRVHVMPMDRCPKPNTRGIQVRLPSGGMLYYHDVQLSGDGLTYISDEQVGVTRKKLYGGLLCEHIVSSTARDILVPSLYRLEEAGFEVLTVVHDEIWGEDRPGRGEEFERLMCINPEWCRDMRITAESKNGVRYLK